MNKKKISIKQKKSLESTRVKLKDNVSVIKYSPTKELLNEDFIGKAILECLKNNDPEGVIEVISAYLETINKTKAAKQAAIPRSTLYYSFQSKNPTIKTLAKLVSATTSLSAKDK